MRISFPVLPCFSLSQIKHMPLYCPIWKAQATRDQSAPELGLFWVDLPYEYKIHTRFWSCHLKKEWKYLNKVFVSATWWNDILFNFFLILFYYWNLIYNVLNFNIWQNDSVIYTQTLFHILFHYKLLQDADHSSLCYTVDPWCLSIVYTVVCIC